MTDLTGLTRSRLPTYPAYKDTGIPWLGRIPAHWDIFRLKTIATNVISPASYKDEDELYVALEHVESWTGRLKTITGNVSFDSQVKRFTADDILFGKLRPYLAKVTRPQRSGVCVGEFLVLRVRTGNVTPVFLELLLRSKPLIDVVDSSTYGAKMPRASWAFIGNLPIVLPPLHEQRLIARYLDWADARIARLIAARERQVALLEEYKQALIHQAVTGQIDVRTGKPYAEYKDSGVEWLGQVPKGWEVQRAKYLFREANDRSVDGSEIHLSMSQRLGLVPSYLVENRTLISENYAGGKLCEVGDLVLNRLKAHLGVFAVAEYAGVTSPDYTILRPVEPNSVKYFESVLRSPACRYELRIRARGIVEGFWRLYTDDFYEIRLPVPPLIERLEIIKYITRIGKLVNLATQSTLKEIKFLREYRTRLITDVVTGKVDVREAARRLEEEVSHRAPAAELKYSPKNFNLPLPD